MKEEYKVVRNLIDAPLTNFLYEYFLLKRRVSNTFSEHPILSKYSAYVNNNEGDTQVKNAFSLYGDPAFEVLMCLAIDVMKEETQEDLIPTYSYARIYNHGDELKPHIDRRHCEYSTTVNLYSDIDWPIYMNETPINLSSGDMCIYKGNEVVHYRLPFEGNVCAQVFLHYVSLSKSNNRDREKYLWEGRPHAGLPKIYAWEAQDKT